jgi:hypothetical protein
MAKTNKKCLSCNRAFIGRRDAKTCSDRCRKQLQRAKYGISRELGEIKEAAKTAIEEIGSLSALTAQNEQGFVAATDTQPVQTITPDPPRVEKVYVQPVEITPPPPYDPQTLAPVNPITKRNTPDTPSYGFYEEPEPVPQTTAQMLTQANEEVLENQPAPMVVASEASPFNLQLRTLLMTTAAIAAIFTVIVFITTLRPSQRNVSDQGGAVTSSNEDLLKLSPGISTINLNRNTVISGGSSLTATGQVIIQNEADSTSAFLVQNAKGSDLLVVDTQNNKVGIGAKPSATGAQLQVVGDISTQGSLQANGGGSVLNNQGLVINNVLVCTAAGCNSRNAASTPDLTGVARLSNSQTFTGSNTFRASSTTALSVQNSSGSLNLLTVDTSNSKVGIGLLPSSSGATLQVSGGIDTSSGFSVNGATGGTFSCAPSELLQQPVFQGGIVISGICVPGAGASVATLQQSYNASVPAQIVLSTVSGMIQIQDAASPLATNLFEVTNNGGATKYFAVNNLGIAVTGNVNTTGQYQINGVALASTNLSDTASIARLGANQTFTGNNTFSSASNSFTGNGAGLTSVNAATLNGNNSAFFTNASNLSSGTVNDARLSANVTLQGNTFNGANQLVQLTGAGFLPALNGSNLTSLNASNLSSPVRLMTPALAPT